MSFSSEVPSTTTMKPVPSNFTNILSDMQKVSDLSYVLKSKNFPVNKFCKHRTTAEMKTLILNSRPVLEVIDKIVADKQWSRKMAMTEAEKIADQMFQNFDLKSGRALAYIAKKVLPRIFSAIYVDSVESVERIRRICVDDPVLFLPTHRTYMDFILLQFICFHFEIPLPAIASAIDFMRMKILGEMLRRSGAYFIRRSFSNDLLYHAIFAEYVQTLVRDCDRTMEVFIEGTRSRTGKSLRPKYGFLSTVLEPFLKNEVFDVRVIPVTVSFSKTLEESLYAYELLGFSKPPETTSGFLKARSILDTNYGDVFVSFAEPMSIREYFSRFPGIDRNEHNFQSPFAITKMENFAIREFAHKVIKIQEAHAVLNLWSLVALQLNAMVAYGECSFTAEGWPSVSLDALRSNVERLYDILSKLDRHISLRTGSLTDELTYLFTLHKNIVRPNSNSRSIDIPSATDPNLVVAASLSDLRSLIGTAVPRLMLASFANQAMHLFAETCFICVNFGGTCSVSSLFDDFSFLQKLFGREFVYQTSMTKETFESALTVAVRANILQLNDEDGLIFVKCDASADVAMLKRLFEPWLIAYYVGVDFLLANRNVGITDKQFIRVVQQSMATKLVQNVKSSSDTVEPRWYQILSADTLKNCLHSLADNGFVVKEHSQLDSHSSTYVPVENRLIEIRHRLDKYISNCYPQQMKILERVQIKSKM